MTYSMLIEVLGALWQVLVRPHKESEANLVLTGPDENTVSEDPLDPAIVFLDAV